jgi:DNA-binding NtrC family response regulator
MWRAAESGVFRRAPPCTCATPLAKMGAGNGSGNQISVMAGGQCEPGRQRGKGHILVVDDDEIFGQAVAQTLRRAGFDVSLAADFRVALEVLDAQYPVDVLVADIVMPASVNGIALSRMARLRRQDLKVVYMTGYHIPGAENEALGPILRKPVDEAALISEIERVMAE